MSALYHYTCADHGDPGIRLHGIILPNWHPLLRHSLVWLTDLPEPQRDGLGLTSESLRCDRTAIRYEVERDAAIWWPTWARRNKVDRQFRDDLESYGLPAHWWVSEEPLLVFDRQLVGAVA